MRYVKEIHISLPRDRVIELFDSTENMKKWQPELVSFEAISGEPGQEGAQSRMLYRMGKREVELVETITVRDFPDKFSGTYEAKGVWNLVENRFEKTGPQATKWTIQTEFKFSGLMMKLMGLLMPGAFKKQTFTMMMRFKEFAESA
ncbi:MAG: SRPBCC family protein [Puniceicoccaceae bacterium]